MNAQQGAAAPPSRSVVAFIIAIIVAALFIFAGGAKISDPSKFARDITNFHIVPYSIAIRFAVYLPWLEIVAGLALLTQTFRRGALAILTPLMLIFIGATISAHARGINLECGCFGTVSKGMSFGTHMLLDCAILAALITLWMFPQRSVPQN
ncbi:MAG TPA: MauE/DoxX family redox-associated membrane protein [Chthoniobacterales bacterium]